MDGELIAYLQAMEQRLTAKIEVSVQAVEQQLTAKIEASVQASEQRTPALIVGVKDSLEREIQEVSAKVDRLSVRLDKIAAGAHYVTRLVEWSEKQDKFQEDFAQRLQNLEARVGKLEKPKEPSSTF